MSGQDLIPIAKELYKQMLSIAWMMLTPAFLLSCVISYVKAPTEFPAFELLRRVVVTIALLSFFPEIVSTIADIANALADRISEKHALEQLYSQLKAQGDPRFQVSKNPFLLRADIGVGLLSYLSYAAAFIAKFLMTALYHFFWALLNCFAPLAILCNLFPGLTHITKNLFSSILEISLWNIVWQMMGVMLLGLQFVRPTSTANYFDAVCFNLLLAIAMVATPILVHSFIRSGLSSPSSLSTAAIFGAVTGPIGQVATAYKFATHTKNQVAGNIKRNFKSRGTS